MKQFIIVLKDYPKSEQFYLDALNSAQQHGWGLERYDAVDARIVNLEQEFRQRNLFISADARRHVPVILHPGAQGCFLSHYNLWKMCIELNETIAIFEEDVMFTGSLPTEDFVDVLKLRKGKFLKDIIRTTGNWWFGTDSYLIKPHAARKIIDWVHKFGVLPADHLLGENVVNIKHLLQDVCVLNPGAELRENSLTWKKNKDLLS